MFGTDEATHLKFSRQIVFASVSLRMISYHQSGGSGVTWQIFTHPPPNNATAHHAVSATTELFVISHCFLSKKAQPTGFYWAFFKVLPGFLGFFKFSICEHIMWSIYMRGFM